MDPDQGAPRRSLICVHTVCQKVTDAFQQTTKADNFKGSHLPGISEILLLKYNCGTFSVYHAFKLF